MRDAAFFRVTQRSYWATPAGAYFFWIEGYSGLEGRPTPMRYRTQAYLNVALVLTSVSPLVLLVELRGHRLVAELTFKFVRDQHLVPSESNAS